MHMLKTMTFTINEFLWRDQAKFLQIELCEKISYFCRRRCDLLEEIDIRPINLFLDQEHPLKAQFQNGQLSYCCDVVLVLACEKGSKLVENKLMTRLRNIGVPTMVLQTLGHCPTSRTVLRQ